MMRHFHSTWILGALLLPLFLGCQPAKEPTKSSSSKVAPATANSGTMKLVVMTEKYDPNGESLDQQIETVDATTEAVTERFNALDWKHVTNRYHLALSGGDINSDERKKLSIIEELPEGSDQTVLIARLEETPPGANSAKYFTFQPLESPDVGLKLLLSFLAQDGEYRTMVDWQEN